MQAYSLKIFSGAASRAPEIFSGMICFMCVHTSSTWPGSKTSSTVPFCRPIANVGQRALKAAIDPCVCCGLTCMKHAKWFHYMAIHIYQFSTVVKHCKTISNPSEVKAKCMSPCSKSRLRFDIHGVLTSCVLQLKPT